MTLISSWGGPDSNSYVDLTSANSYITTAILDDTAWTGATTLSQEKSLQRATRDVDSRQYIGGRYFHDQFLEFPRQIRLAFPWNRTHSSSTVFSVEHKRMEEHVKRATCHQALWLLRMGGRNIHQERIVQGVRSWSESVGPMREFVQYGPGASNSTGKLDPDALSYLQDWVTGRKVFRA